MEMAEQTDYCGFFREKQRQIRILEIFYGELKKAPIIKSCHLCIECKLQCIYEMVSNDLFVGEIVAGYADDSCLANGKVDSHKFNPLLLIMPDNSYWKAGDFVGKAWSIGKKRSPIPFITKRAL